MEYSQKAKIFAQLGENAQKIAGLVTQIQNLQTEVSRLKEQEKELHRLIGMPEDGPDAPKRKRITKEETNTIRTVIINTMRNLKVNGLEWLSPDLIVQRVAQELPNAEDAEIGRQIRALVSVENSPLEHNGHRGQASMYRVAG